MLTAYLEKKHRQSWIHIKIRTKVFRQAVSLMKQPVFKKKKFKYPVPYVIMDRKTQRKGRGI